MTVCYPTPKTSQPGPPPKNGMEAQHLFSLNPIYGLGPGLNLPFTSKLYTPPSRFTTPAFVAAHLQPFRRPTRHRRYSAITAWPPDQLGLNPVFQLWFVNRPSIALNDRLLKHGKPDLHAKLWLPHALLQLIPPSPPFITWSTTSPRPTYFPTRQLFLHRRSLASRPYQPATPMRIPPHRPRHHQ